ncbi:hypothetical protein Micbo1qcDRAFT_194698 [Microdochium bolleyi]|uniref:Uncharacterized protein n=1 Tax=Microdochium bolleyi TaxID=196109 RepID=A0A136J8T4_9PEZI|nr:hypothetical protein Micbo1qcDRAFT_194698 [Microdochium bolleyi]
MASKYSITVRNDSHHAQSFMLFQELPHPINLAQYEAFTTVVQHSGRVGGEGDSRVTFKVAAEYTAICGTAETNSDDGTMQIMTTESRDAFLGPSGSSFVLSTLPGADGKPDGTAPDFKSQGRDTRTPGAFTIRTDSTFDVENPNKIYLGIGLKDASSGGDLVPIQAYEAQPNVLYQFSPRPRYCVAYGNYTVGTVVSMAELGNVLTVDFTGAPIREAEFTLDKHNNYVPDAGVETGGIKWKQSAS